MTATKTRKSEPEQPAAQEQQPVVKTREEQIKDLEAFHRDWLPDGLLRAEEASMLFGIDASAFRNAESAGELPLTFRPNPAVVGIGRSHHESGYKLSNIIQWIKSKDIEFELTPMVAVWMTLTPEEAIDASADYSGADVARLFGIAWDVIDAACTQGELCDDRFKYGVNQIPGAVVAAWIKRIGIQPRWSFQIAAKVTRRRHIAASSKLDVMPSKETETFADQAIARMKEADEVERAQGLENRKQLLATYRTILHRVDDPKEGDILDLPLVARELGFGPDKIRQDLAAVAEVRRLEALSKTSPQTESALIKASDAVKAMHKRHKAEIEEAQKALTVARRMHNESTYAPAEMRALREKNRELFDS